MASRPVNFLCEEEFTGILGLSVSEEEEGEVTFSVSYSNIRILNIVN